MTPREKPSTVFVTGGTGFVGRALVRALVADASVTVRCLVRDVRRAERAGIPDSAAILGSLEDADALRRGAAGADAVIHVAGAVRALTAADFDRINAGGTRNLLTATSEVAPGARFVHVSSLAAVGPSVEGAGTARPPELCTPVSAYGESKRRAELLVAASDLAWIGIRPPVVYGPDDDATALLVGQARAALTAVPWNPRPLSIVHVDDAVEALLLALRADASHVWLPLDGPDRTDTSELMRAIASALGRRARILPVPLAIVRAAAVLADGWARVRRRPSFFSSDKVREIAAPGWVADPEPARRAIGFQARIGLDEGLRALLRRR